MVHCIESCFFTRKIAYSLPAIVLAIVFQRYVNVYCSDEIFERVVLLIDIKASVHLHPRKRRKNAPRNFS